MSNTVTFDRTYADFGGEVREFEKAPEVIAAINVLMKEWPYSIEDFLGARFTAEWLGSDQRPAKVRDLNDHDLIFEMGDTGFYELVLRNDRGDSVYGGWLIGLEPVVVTDEVVHGHRVILTTLEDGTQQRHDYFPNLGYGPASGASAMALGRETQDMLRRAV
ncbi:MAG: hypothetical protein AAFR35_04075 [Pseudomonadota bacterium]